MGTTIYGAGSNQSRSMMNGMLSVKNSGNINSTMAGIRKTDQTVKKQLNYNHREISGQLMRAKKTQGAANVLSRAKRRLAVLQRQAGSGQYDSKEVANAIAHARRMVRCAQLKMRNLKQEEQERRVHDQESGERERQQKNEVKRRVAQKEREIKSKAMIEEMQEVSREKRKRSEMIQKRRMHRNQERAKINEADMKYIKGQMESGRGESVSAACGQGAVLDLSMEAAAMAEVQMLEMMTNQQIEAEIEAEVAADMSLETGGISAGISGFSAAAGGETAAVDGGMVDVSV